MEVDILDYVLSSLAFGIYGAIIAVSLIFTFSLETYKKLDSRLNLELWSTSFFNPLARNLDVVDCWLMDNNKLVGPALIILSIIDMQFWFAIINLPKSLLSIG